MFTPFPKSLRRATIRQSPPGVSARTRRRRSSCAPRCCRRKNCHERAQDLQRLADLVESGAFKPVIGHVYPFTTGC
jgi:NADPH:quinone reductase-like Zn-dependent oxidoreductase